MGKARIYIWMLSSVHFLHLGSFIRSALHLLKRRQVIIISKALVIIIDAQAKLDHTVNASSKLCGLIEVETRGQEGCIEKEPDQILDGLVRLVSCSFLPQLCHDGVLWINLHSLLGDHVRGHGVVTQSLCLHDTLHVGGPSVLGCGKDTRRVSHARADDDLFHLVTQHLLHELGERLKLSLELLKLLLLIFVLDIKALLGDTLELLAIKLLELLHSILIDRVNHVENLKAFLAKRLDEG